MRIIYYCIASSLSETPGSPGGGSMESQTEADQHYLQQQQTNSVVYQASSPDEVVHIFYLSISLSFFF